ncbi:putative beta prime cop protein [Trypanosoma grayi]|uniref:putative beta prime cop protein n=1 Tax=Trypanosoma grayi TaxID=71804 RepID=UPI0004F47E83|nr:putative beta prime cop protein [Trypanosoma grayi]KEG09147.1 putative beta prime cop protein [Trypanosoma grayi]
MSGKAIAAPATLMTAASDRVKMVDMHPKEPLFLCSLYSGVINLWNLETQTLLKSFDTGTGLPVRCVRFIPRLQSFACGTDDMMIRIFNYNTMEKTKTFQAHEDYIRGIGVHEHLSLLMTCSDDMTIRQWDWSKNWALVNTHEGHMHYVMGIAFNPKDPSTFATASLDCTVKVWSINSPVPNFQLEGHEDGVNCVDYYPGGDKPYLLSGSDDQTVRLWDYQTRACLQVFSHHAANVTAVLFHPSQPLLFTLAEDMEMKIIASDTHRLLLSIDHSRMNRGWSMAAKRYANVLVVGYDGGTVVYKIGEDKPVYSMDPSGKILVAVGNEVTRIDAKGIPVDAADGDVLSLPTKDMGAVETSPSAILHGPSGQFIALLGENDYTVLSSLSMRPKSYGKCISFVWGPENGSYAVLETSMTLKVYKNFKERATIALNESAEKLFGGPLFSVCTASSITFYDWATLSLIRQIDECPKMVQWSESGELLAIVTETAFFTLRFSSEAVMEYLETQEGTPEEGLDFAFDVVEEVGESVKEVLWVGECLVFINQAHRLSYYIGGETNSIAVLSRNQYLLGYLPKENRIMCIDKEKNVTSYVLRLNVIEYMAAIVREDFATAEQLLPSVEKSERLRLAQFLQAKNHLEQALKVTTEENHRFELAVQLGRLQLAKEIAERSPSMGRWKQVADLAMERGMLKLAEDALCNCGDNSGLLLLYSCMGDMEAISKLGDACIANGKANVAFTCFHLTGRYEENVDLLCRTGKVAEAAFYARTYCHSKVEEVVAKWKVTLAALPRVGEAIASPVAYPNLFPSMRAAPSVVLETPQRGRGDHNDTREEQQQQHHKQEQSQQLPSTGSSEVEGRAALCFESPQAVKPPAVTHDDDLMSPAEMRHAASVMSASSPGEVPAAPPPSMVRDAEAGAVPAAFFTSGDDNNEGDEEDNKWA